MCRITRTDGRGSHVRLDNPVKRSPLISAADVTAFAITICFVGLAALAVLTVFHMTLVVWSMVVLVAK